MDLQRNLFFIENGGQYSKTKAQHLQNQGHIWIKVRCISPGSKKISFLSRMNFITENALDTILAGKELLQES